MTFESACEYKKRTLKDNDRLSVSINGSAISDHGCQQSRSEIARRVHSVRCRNYIKVRLPEINGDLPVCIPNDAPSPRIRMNNTSGRSPFGGGELPESVVASTRIIKTAVARNSEKKQET